jgi:hypothetical protein
LIDQGATGPDGAGGETTGGGATGGWDGCVEGEILDCDNNCVDGFLLEDGVCNDGINGVANLNCSGWYFDGNCQNNFENCNPDCPVGILEFGNIDVDLSDNANPIISGQLEINMNCQYDVSY